MLFYSEIKCLREWHGFEVDCYNVISSMRYIFLRCTTRVSLRKAYKDSMEVREKEPGNMISYMQVVFHILVSKSPNCTKTI